MLRRLMMMATLFFFSAAQADVIGIHGGIGYWAYEFNGDAISDISLDNDFNITSDNGGHAYTSRELFPWDKTNTHTGPPDSTGSRPCVHVLFGSCHGHWCSNRG